MDVYPPDTAPLGASPNLFLAWRRAGGNSRHVDLCRPARLHAEEAREGAPAFRPRLAPDAERVFRGHVIVGELRATLGYLAAVDVAVADQSGDRFPVRIGIGPGEIAGDA